MSVCVCVQLSSANRSQSCGIGSPIALIPNTNSWNGSFLRPLDSGSSGHREINSLNSLPGWGVHEKKINAKYITFNINFSPWAWISLKTLLRTAKFAMCWLLISLTGYRYVQDAKLAPVRHSPAIRVVENDSMLRKWLRHNQVWWLWVTQRLAVTY